MELSHVMEMVARMLVPLKPLQQCIVGVLIVIVQCVVLLE